MKLFSKSKGKLKHHLSIKQNKEVLSLAGIFNNEDYLAEELWLFSRNEGEKLKIAEIEPTNKFQFKVDLNKVMEELLMTEESTFDWYVKVRRSYSEIGQKIKDRDDLEIIEENNQKIAKYFIRLGRFENTELDSLPYFYKNSDFLINYITLKGNFSIVLNETLNLEISSQIDKLKTKKNQLIIEGKLFTKNSSIENAEIVLKARNQQIELVSGKITFRHLKDETEKKYGLNRYTYEVVIELDNIQNGEILNEDVYDVFINLKIRNTDLIKIIRVGKPTFRAKYLNKEVYCKNDKEAIIVNPYYTFKKLNLSLEVFQYPLETYNYLRKMMRWSWLIQLFNKSKDIWIVGEKPNKAQDTGLTFFKYLRENHPKKNAYYVIEKNSPEAKNVEQLDQVLEYKSKEHIWYTIIATKVISSHHPDYLYPLRTSRFKKKVKGIKVFLQHGVMGTKNMVSNYGKSAIDFDTDVFMVSSDFEKEMIVNDFGYNPNDVFVTGLSRFDTLFKNDVVKQRNLLIIPTWRDWLATVDRFMESEYYQRYQELIHSERLHDLASKYNFKIIFCLHPNMQKYAHFFEDAPVTVINQGDVDVQHLIKESSMMITDYSSVGFDFSFLEKPILYYQFDRNKFIGKMPSHLDLDNDLPGRVCFDLFTLLTELEEYSKDNFVVKEKYINRANKFIKNKDTSSSERIFKVISNYTNEKSVVQKKDENLLLKELFNRFRKSRFYYPMMKLFYRIGTKIIPVDKKLILFESGLGKQYGDSPRYIYEAVVKKKIGYSTVWVYNKNHEFLNPETKSVKRLSPLYYYYLLRSKYWVNNQNFPNYIVKRPETTFLQTWHGTPLKKMLYDIETVQGRSEGYVDRIGSAINNWDYLISPSDYASKAFRSAFQYEGEILEVGYPRNDLFFAQNQNNTLVGDIVRSLNLPEGKKILLYAPTFRDNKTTKNNKFVFDIDFDLDKLYEEFHEDYVLLLRMHVVISNRLYVDPKYNDFVFNVSDYPEMQELLVISNVLITDYSSVMFDFANSNKPILFYTYDLKEYRDNTRGFYIDFEEEAPGPLLFNTEELLLAIKDLEQFGVKYNQKYKDFQQKYCYLEDGNATQRVVDKFFK
ncbi:CDP-glycerol glycerophosphotransferase family protein [Bacillaceae bacterium IKA-2]|nr:CDP-glycerol glycerophosphotransferase family protein [Bacillaceae bacterium IKA-2]